MRIGLFIFNRKQAHFRFFVFKKTLDIFAVRNNKEGGNNNRENGKDRIGIS